MGTQITVKNKEAVDKLKEMFGSGQILIFCCGAGTFPIDATPMSTQKVDDEGNVWFFSARDSDRNRLVEKDPRSQLIYSNSGDMEFMSIHGSSDVFVDAKKAEELWSKHVEVWFPEGPSDPNLTLIKFTPDEGYYWDTKNGKLISLAKWAGSLVTGETNDDSREGRIVM